MDSDSLIANLKRDDLTVEETALVAWEIGVVEDMDGVAQFLYRGGPYPPQASVKRPTRNLRSGDDRRPEKKYWDFVKAEMAIFLCQDDKRYRELWKRLGSLETKGTTTIVGVIAAYFGEKAGVPATLLGGFVAVVLYGAVKLGRKHCVSFCTNATHKTLAWSGQREADTSHCAYRCGDITQAKRLTIVLADDRE